MNIVFAGIIGRHPYGGVAWCSLMYLLGLRRLGHRVWYLEDTGECNFDPLQNALSKDPRYALNFIHACLEPHGFGDRWCYVDWLGGYHGTSAEEMRRVCAAADLFIDLSGGCWYWRDEYTAIPHSAFIDSDPAFTQLAIEGSMADPSYRAFFARFGALFTFGRNIGTPAGDVPTNSFDWQHTWQPVDTDQWQPVDETPRPCFSTVMTWRIESFKGIGGNKDSEFRKILHLPAVSPVPLELAVNGPDEMLREHGWRCVSGLGVSQSLDTYRDYIRSSLGEFSVAKQTYVRTNSGWFSDRTECYLASGRPAVVQDTGFSRHLPTGEGLFSYTNADEALAGLEAVVADYKRHSRQARELALAHFASEVVLPPLLDYATSRPSGAAVSARSTRQGDGAG